MSNITTNGKLDRGGVGYRLKQLRQQLHLPSSPRRLSQAAFARVLNVTRVRLAAYENQVNPLNFAVGWQACRQANFSQIWLASGAGPNQPFFDFKFDAAAFGITDQTTFLTGTAILWEKLLQAAVAAGVPITAMPPKLESPRRGTRPLPLDQIATGKIKVSAADRSAGCLRVTLEYLAGCATEGLPMELVITHPGPESMTRYQMAQHEGARALVALLRDALPPGARGDDFLRRLAPFFLIELELAVLKLVGVHPI
jgi:hypothetical protein